MGFSLGLRVWGLGFLGLRVVELQGLGFRVVELWGYAGEIPSAVCDGTFVMFSLVAMHVGVACFLPIAGRLYAVLQTWKGSKSCFSSRHFTACMSGVSIQRPSKQNHTQHLLTRCCV